MCFNTIMDHAVIRLRLPVMGTKVRFFNIINVLSDSKYSPNDSSKYRLFNFQINIRYFT